jgi:SAM-dependent methyltransferase
MHSNSPRYDEHLRRRAAEAYELAGRLCDTCGDLHALWPYIRLSRASTGIETQTSKLGAELSAFFASGHRDLLIAGSADTGLLAHVARAGTDHALGIFVLDICETPLVLCRRFADRWSLPVETVRQDLIELDFKGRFDIVLVHGTLQFISAANRGEMLLRLRRALRPSGRLILLFNTSRPVPSEIAADSRAEYASGVLDELKRLEVPLPDTEATMRRRLEAHARQREVREGAFSGPEAVEALLQTAGLRLERCTPVAVNIARPMDSLISTISKRRFMALAQPTADV